MHEPWQNIESIIQSRTTPLIKQQKHAKIREITEGMDDDMKEKLISYLLDELQKKEEEKDSLSYELEELKKELDHIRKSNEHTSSDGWTLFSILERCKKLEITPSTSLEKLRAYQIIPVWLYKEATSHGMSEAENLLCEFDWEWGWDLGDGMTKPQLAILKSVRTALSQYIK